MTVNLNPNLQAINTRNGLEKSEKTLKKSMQRLSSGLRINQAKEDPAGLAIAQQLVETVRGLNISMGAVQDGYNLLATAESGMGEAQAALQEMRELAVQASNGTLSDDDRAALQAQFSANAAALDDVAAQVRFNGLALLDGSTSEIEIQVGAEAGETLDISVGSVTASDLGVAGLDVGSSAGAQAAVSQIDDALRAVSERRSALGAFRNRAESAIGAIGVTMENVQAAHSRIVDADFAKEAMKLAKGGILEQTGLSALAQGRMSAENVLSLIG